MERRWYTVSTYDPWGRFRRTLIGRYLTLGEALQWLRTAGSASEPITTLFEDRAGKWVHLPWAWSGLEKLQASKLAAQSTWGSRA
jgi:hypothetical protein